MNIIIIILITSLTIYNTIFAGLFGSITNQSTSSNLPFISIYNDLEVEPRLDALSMQFQYGIPSFLTTTTTLNGGTVTTSNSEAVLTTGGTAGAVAGLQTKTNLQYRSGHQADAYFTAAFTGTIAANTKQYIGILDSSNGFGIGYNGTSFGIVLRKNGTDTFTPQSSFNGDTLNGSGSSGFNYNSSLLNVFHIAYGWLGASIIQFQIMSSNGSWITFHTIQYPNSASTPSIANALLPISAQVYDPSGGHSLSLKTASWNMGIVGIQSNVANRFFGVNNTITIGTTESHLLTLRNNNTFNSVVNKMNLQLQRYYASLINNSNFVGVIINIYKNATVTGTSFSSVNSSSIASFSTAGTYSAGTGTLVISQISNNRAWALPEYLDLNSSNIILYPGETLTATITMPAGAASNIVIGGINWAELF